MVCLKLTQRLYNCFQQCFVKIGESLAEAFEGSSEGFMFNTRVPMDTLYNTPSIEPSFVLKELKKMSEHKATGLDGITSKSLKTSTPTIVIL